MKVTYQYLTKHGKTWLDKNIEKIKKEMACPQCGLSYDDPKPYPFTDDDLIAHCQPGYFAVIKVYSPMDFETKIRTDIDFNCYSCDAEWMVSVEEPK